MGYVIAPEYISTRIARVPIGYRPASFIQKAGVAALNGPWEPIEKMKEEYDLRRRYFGKRLNEIEGIDCQMPEGAFYVFPNIRDVGMKSVNFSKTLLEKRKVWVTPGLMFGPSGEYHIRMPLIKPIETLETVADAIETHVKNI
jgi:aspartate/methionine/tyrosine aminotransferase